MSTFQENEFGFKRLTLENWLTIDPIWSVFAMSTSRPNPWEAWVADVLATELGLDVPLNIRKLFVVARSTLIYSLMFYPLLTLGSEQLYRVFEAAASVKCKANGASPKVRVFAQKVEWLVKNGFIAVEQHPRWKAIIYLRNGASHPADQTIVGPSDALSILDGAIELINSLFSGG